MSECTHDCSSCSSNCSGAQPQSLIASPHKGSSIKKVIGVVSGKGGVGKSMVTDLLAVAFSRKGYHCAIMDADITGPSIPKAFGLTQKAEGTQDTIYPVKTKTGIDVMSINLLLENETDPVIWRGPVIAGAVKQFWTDVLWEDVDYRSAAPPFQNCDKTARYKFHPVCLADPAELRLCFFAPPLHSSTNNPSQVKK